MKQWLCILFVGVLLVSCGAEDTQIVVPDENPTSVSAQRIINADSEPGQWMSHGRTYTEQRYSPLDQVNVETIDQLSLAWHFDLPTMRGIEATPLVIDGVMYTTSAWSVVYAIDAKTGALLWEFDPEVAGAKAYDACCDVVNRGVAAWNGKIYVGALDGRLIALDAETGALVWSVDTFDPAKPYTITGAPRVVKGKVIIGNGGAEYPVRGYVTAYDAETGAQDWRFYTVPGNPADGFENDTLREAAKTWKGEWWREGGGGTVWDSMAYDPELDLLYIGVGNGSPWNQSFRSPGGGDNLFLSSIVALNPDTGDYVWHFQTTPGETWDYTATQHMILADLEIDGRVRKVLMQAPKNGFFYVLDRVTGAFISGENFVEVNWATGLDESGRPIEVPEARYDKTGKPFNLLPSGLGGHSWQPMAFSPDTGLVYIPALEIPGYLVPLTAEERKDARFNSGVNFSAAAFPDDPSVRAAVDKVIKGHLAAWDPVTQSERWRVQYPKPGAGGVLATAGNLVFQGLSSAEFAAYRADTGALVWKHHAQTGIVAGPISYSVDGEQFIAVMAGWGGAFPFASPAPVVDKRAMGGVTRVLVYKIGGEDALPELDYQPAEWTQPPPQFANTEVIAHGNEVYHRYCFACHGGSAMGSGVIPDLRRSYTIGDAVSWRDIVFEGALTDNGMIGFKGKMTAEDAEAVRAYVITRARAEYDGFINKEPSR